MSRQTPELCRRETIVSTSIPLNVVRPGKKGLARMTDSELIRSRKTILAALCDDVH